MSRREALVLAGHGSQHHPDSAAPLHAHADRVRESGHFEEVRTAFWKEEPTLRGVRDTLDSDVAYVVPVLTSEGYFAEEVFPRELGVADGDESSDPDGPELRYADPVGTHDAMTDVIAARIDSAIEGPPSEAGVALVGHGTERHAGSGRSTAEHARRVRDRGDYAEVAALYLDEAPHVGELYDRLDAHEIAVVPVFVADGYHTTRDVPRAIDHPGVGESAVVDGRVVHYAGAVGTEPRLADVIVERAIEAGAVADQTASADVPSPAAEAFRRRVESATDGLAWGQLWIVADSGGYELRHRDDVATPTAELETLDGPRDLRARVRRDDRGRYRPLSGARTLPTGWRLADLGPAERFLAVRFAYPESVADWWNGRRGTLDLVDFEETVARQTGIYADLDEVEGSTLSPAVEAVCGDCVRRRCWRTGGDEPAEGAERGGAGDDDDAIPCREACPFLLSAVHAFDDADGVDPAEWPDSAVPAAAFEEPGNRYRVRFARALARSREEASPATVAGGDR